MFNQPLKAERLGWISAPLGNISCPSRRSVHPVLGPSPSKERLLSPAQGTGIDHRISDLSVWEKLPSCKKSPEHFEAARTSNLQGFYIFVRTDMFEKSSRRPDQTSTRTVDPQKNERRSSWVSNFLSSQTTVDIEFANGKSTIESILWSTETTLQDPFRSWSS